MSLAGPARPSDVPCPDVPTSAALVVLVCGDTELASWPLAGGDHPDLSLVDDLARLQLAARRRGCSIRLRQVSVPLWELLTLTGLAGAVTSAGECLVVEVGGEPEGGEDAGVEERAQYRDPPT